MTFDFEIFNKHANNTNLVICQSVESAREFHKMVQKFIDNHDDVGVIGIGRRKE